MRHNSTPTPVDDGDVTNVEFHNFWSQMLELRQAARDHDLALWATCLDEIEGMALNTDERLLRNRCVAVLLEWRPKHAAAVRHLRLVH